MQRKEDFADAAFDALDTNHDGVITREEMQGAVQHGKLKVAGMQEQQVPDLRGGLGEQPRDQHGRGCEAANVRFSTDPSLTIDSEPPQLPRSEPVTWDREKASVTCFDRPYMKFEGQSSTHENYVAPPLDALNRVFADRARGEHLESDHAGVMGDRQEVQIPSLHFHGESTSRSDYRPLPLDALKESLAAPRRPPGESELEHRVPVPTRSGGSSCMRDDLRPLAPEDALRADMQASCNLWESRAGTTGAHARFNVESSMHQDYAPPPLDAFKRNCSSAESQNVCPAPCTRPPKMRLDCDANAQSDFQARGSGLGLCAVGAHPSQASQVRGETSMRRDYQPPPVDALINSLAAPKLNATSSVPCRKPVAQFEGESSTLHDFRSPPLDAYRNTSETHDCNVTFSRDVDNTPKFLQFNGESSMRQDYLPPSLEHLRNVLTTPKTSEECGYESRPAARFEGESVNHTDFQAPLRGALRRAVHAEETREKQTPPFDMTFGQSQFQGVSSMHRDYQPPPLDALRKILDEPRKAEVFCDLQRKFESESVTHHDFQAPPLEALRRALHASGETDHPKQDPERPVPVLFEGESSMRHDYQAPPLDALRGALGAPQELGGHDEPRSQSGPAGKFQGGSSTHRDFQTPLRSANGQEHRKQDSQIPALTRFEGESSMRHDYQAPPLHALQGVLQAPQDAGGLGGQQSQARYVTKFVGESSTHCDFQAPSMEALRRVLSIAEEQEHRKLDFGRPAPARFEGESSMRQDYQPPPMDALRSVLDGPQVAGGLMDDPSHSKPIVKFEGESSTHHDFQPPSLHAFRAALQGTHEEEHQKKDSDKPAPARFEGESSMRQDYQAPSMDALRRVLDAPQVAGVRSDDQPMAKPVAKFEGESSTHHDFQAPPLDAFRGALHGIPEQAHRNRDSERRAPAHPAQVRFEGESSMRQDYQAPPMDALRRVLDAPQSVGGPGDQQSQSRPTAKFEGESSTHHDFQAPSMEALRSNCNVADEPENRNRRSERSAPARFEGESSMRQDYQAPPLDALRRVHDAPHVAGGLGEQQPQSRPAAKFEGESSTHHDFQAPSMEALRRVLQVSGEQDRQKPESEMPPPGRFEGESSMRRDYQAPPEEFLRRALDDPGLTVRDPQPQSRPAVRFEGESSTHHDFQAPSLEALRRGVHITNERKHQTQDSEGQVTSRFEGESSMRHDYQAPPLDALKNSSDLQQGPSRFDEWRSQSRPTAKFEGESSTHHDFQAPSLEALRAVLRIADGQGHQKGHPQMPAPAAFEGESSMRQDYQAPPMDAMRRALSASRNPNAFGEKQSHSRPAVKFEGQSSTHRDFQAPSVEEFHRGLNPPDEQRNQMRGSETSVPSRFEGESSMRRDYQAPELDALRKVSDAPQVRGRLDEPQSQSRPVAKLEGESSTHRDFPAPSLEDLRRILQGVGGKDHQKENSDRHTHVRFEGESTMRQDYQAPALDPLRRDPTMQQTRGVSSDDQSRPIGRLDGESSTHRDFQAPSLEALCRVLQDVDKQPHCKPASERPTPSKFEAESSMRQDYQAPPQDALRSALAPPLVPGYLREPHLSSKSTAKFEGQSSSHRDFQAPSLDAYRRVLHVADEDSHQKQDSERPRPARFEGESSMRRDFQAPNMDALQDIASAHRSPSEPRSKLRTTRKFEGESSTHHDFQAPSREALSGVTLQEKGRREQRRQDGSAPASQRFEGKSSTHQDYQAPLSHALQGVSVAPQEQRSQPRPDARFEGESSTHRDFQAPSTDALLQALRTTGGQELFQHRAARPASARFQGESSMRHDYPAHNVDNVGNGAAGLQGALLLRGPHLQAKPAAKFHGESSTHRDFRDPSQQASLTSSRGCTAYQRESKEANGPADTRFECESSTRRDYVAPPRSAVRSVWATRQVSKALGESFEPTSKFEGESSTHRDFQAPFVDDLGNARSRFQHTAEPRTHLLAAGTEDKQPAFHDGIRIRTRETKCTDGELHSCTESTLPPAVNPTARRAQSLDCKQNAHAKFEAQACMHPEGQNSSQRAAGRASSLVDQSRPSPRQTPTCLEGGSTSHNDFRPKQTRARFHKAIATPQRAGSLDGNSQITLQTAGEFDESRGTPRRIARFEGESSMHRDFQPPYLKAPETKGDHVRPAMSSRSEQASLGEETSHMDSQAVSMKWSSASRRSCSADCNPWKSSMQRDFQHLRTDGTQLSYSRAEDLEEARRTHGRDRPRFQGQSTMQNDFRPPACNQLHATMTQGARPTVRSHSLDRSGAQHAVDMPRERCGQSQRHSGVNEPVAVMSWQKGAACNLCPQRDFKDNRNGGGQESPRSQGSIAAAAAACFDADTTIPRSYHHLAAASPRSRDPSQGSRRASEARRVHILKNLPGHLTGQDPNTQRKESSANELECGQEIREAVAAGKLLRQKDCKMEPRAVSLTAGMPSRVRRGSMPPRQGSLGAGRHTTPEISSTALAGHADSATWSPKSAGSTVRTSTGSRMSRAAPKFEGESSTHRDFRPPPPEALREAFRPPQQRPRSAPTVPGTGRYNRS
eukprot:TRINITY_DN10332_c0_g1_i1.p1 TRINITY_DN10332_c0_g1~~TRINITY_DN10332_c0_g1_i1.p1  ORF type:complete len:2529 (+),score=354.99 TRINITY_DN10332_c0_g1_i1:127-7713(+)